MKLENAIKNLPGMKDYYSYSLDGGDGEYELKIWLKGERRPKKYSFPNLNRFIKSCKIRSKYYKLLN